MTERTEYWWITSKAWNLPDPTPARVTFDYKTPTQVLALGREDIYHPKDVRLIERVLPAGRAAAEEREACAALVEPKEPCPCDCGGRCYCGNAGDHRDMMDWLTSTDLAKAIRERVTNP